MALRSLSGFVVLGAMFVLSAATLRAADSRQDDYVQLIVKLIGENDREFRAAGLEQVRTAARGPALTRLFAAQLAHLNPGGQVALLDALGDRGDSTARPALLELLSASHEASVRAAAIGALGKLGGEEDLPLFLKTLAGGSPAEQAAAQAGLIQLRGETINKALGADTKSASSRVKAALIEVLATRRAGDQLPVFLAASVDENARVRKAAMEALGLIGPPDQLARMVPGVLKAHKGFERDQAEKNVSLVCERIGNEDERGAALIAAVNTVDAAHRDQLLSLLGRVGGKKLLNFVAEIATSDNAARRDLAIDALSKWPDASVADTLFDLAMHATEPAQRNEAFRGYVKVSATRDRRSDKERLERLKQAMKLAKTPEDVSLVINRIRTAYDVEAVRFVLPYVDQPPFSQIACETIVEIAHHREVRDPNKAEVDKALDKVIKVSKNPVVVERANRYKRGETWDRRSSKSRR